MSQFWSPAVRDLEPYVPGEQPRDTVIKLNTNENPYPPAPGVAKVLADYPIDHLRRYPDPSSLALREALAAHYGVHVNQVFVGNGSDEVLAFAFKAFFCREQPLAVPSISYSFYPVYCDFYGITPHKVPLTDSFEVDLDAFPTDNGGIVFANPNAPTGHAHSRAAIEALLDKHTSRVVLVDEAYIDFGGESAIPLIERYPNLLVTGTFSKSRSLAGLRIGFAIGPADLIDGLDRVKDSFNSYPLDSVAVAAGVASIKDDAYYRACCASVIATRERTTAALEACGIEVLPSSANFVFARPTTIEAGMLFDALRARGILVRYFNKPGLDQFLRISIGTDDEMDYLIDAVHAIVGEK
ncbi:histidinol-phosphate transaminase [Larsenimonas suaedae]|uniref:Histidinol-phosphate aminotransferase n=1 Tax=Larsenimonas suaedae TaxID=1851019 RepID=A0ABU1GWA8_9GAMM|nr:histidinol-phosphate transaminase [Larsenimonas suaedae]MCM2973431.1 histidinol-phosphate transaminase [Larsenimonas suaedae]MDR5896324.1 histidinol-phosphate transaminase [Larsenimonas suaedae]